MNWQQTGLAAGLVLGATALAAGTERVSMPKGFGTDFLRYTVVDRQDRKIARFMYITARSWQAARAGEPLPDGTVIVMEDHKVRMAGEESLVMDSRGRLIPTDETTNVFVMEKRAGWGADYPEELRNGDWEYAWFSPDGTRSERPMTGCFECHKAQAEEDFTFSVFPALAEQR